MRLFGWGEKRKYPRVQSFNLARCEYPARSFAIQLTNLVNISEGGIQFICPDVFQLSDEIQMTINLAELGRDIQVRGKIVWVRRNGSDARSHACRVGAAFTEMADPDREAIREFVRSR